MVISIFLFVGTFGGAFVALKLFLEIRRQRVEARMGRAIRMACIQ
ncbi:hypothetical protein SBA3_3860003 [Candidatus Sulfopaludibacter sp. SbA3]|nr:hypothetical protein SBA3_3860003 [Candidatus Sulfopaludibacter sp. SbA3]